MNIAFLAHDKKKELMVQFCTAYKSILARGNGPENCVECGACEAKCPQHIDIINKLKDAMEYFDRL